MHRVADRGLEAVAQQDHSFPSRSESLPVGEILDPRIHVEDLFVEQEDLIGATRASPQVSLLHESSVRVRASADIRDLPSEAERIVTRVGIGLLLAAVAPQEGQRRIAGARFGERRP